MQLTLLWLLGIVWAVLELSLMTVFLLLKVVTVVFAWTTCRFAIWLTNKDQYVLPSFTPSLDWEEFRFLSWWGNYKLYMKFPGRVLILYIMRDFFGSFRAVYSICKRFIYISRQLDACNNEMWRNVTCM